MNQRQKSMQMFEDLLQAGSLTVRVTTEKSTVVLQHDLSSASLESTMSDNSSVAVSGDSLLVSSDSSDATVIVHTNGGTRTHAEPEVAKGCAAFITNDVKHHAQIYLAVKLWVVC
ncbi:hypothetical protein XENOCAPTIV_028075 [Xenoophorus captivus]|uniref:Uncharacterized protein n=1 Tax=Xenoophorus captivus TaxID=1517983 RepID=A0ABV0QVH7_9TELE